MRSLSLTKSRLERSGSDAVYAERISIAVHILFIHKTLPESIEFQVPVNFIFVPARIFKDVGFNVLHIKDLGKLAR